MVEDTFHGASIYPALLSSSRVLLHIISYSFVAKVLGWG